MTAACNFMPLGEKCVNYEIIEKEKREEKKKEKLLIT